MNKYLMSCVFLTRFCPMHCDYCRLRDSKLTEPELIAHQWKSAFSILDELGCSFHLILGNEPLAMPGLVDFIGWMRNRTPYAMYSSCAPGLFDRLKGPLAEAGLQNLSCGCDILDFDRDIELGDMEIKSRRAYKALQEAKVLGVPDRHGTLTVSRKTLGHAFKTIEQLTSKDIWVAVNFIHWDKDGGFDFFPKAEEIPDLLFREEDKNWFEDVVGKMREGVLNGTLQVQNPPEYFSDAIKHGRDMSCHCEHSLIHSVDADGRMRCCGYRRGTRSPQFSIFDLPKRFEEYQEANRLDRQECQGCFWSYWWQADYFLNSDQKEFGIRVFQVHDSKYFKEKKQ